MEWENDLRNAIIKCQRSLYIRRKIELRESTYTHTNYIKNTREIINKLKRNKNDKIGKINFSKNRIRVKHELCNGHTECF